MWQAAARGRGSLDVPTVVLSQTDLSCEMRRSCSEERLCSSLIHPLRLVQCIQEPLFECSSRSGGGKCWWESRTQYPARASAHFVRAVHSPSSPVSPLLLALCPIQPIRVLSLNDAGGWDVLSWPELSPEALEKPMQKFSWI